jgi:hypothetical protein
MLACFLNVLCDGKKNLSWRREKWQGKFARKNEVAGKRKPVVGGKICKTRHEKNIEGLGNGGIDGGRRFRR